MVVVNAELYCVQSTVEYIRTNLQNKMLSYYSRLSACSSMKSDFDNATQLTTSDYGLPTMAMMLHLKPRYNSTATRSQHWTRCSVLAQNNSAVLHQHPPHTKVCILTPWCKRGWTGWGKTYLTSLCIPLPGKRNTAWQNSERNTQKSCIHYKPWRASLWMCLVWHSMEDRTEKISEHCSFWSHFRDLMVMTQPLTNSTLSFQKLYKVVVCIYTEVIQSRGVGTAVITLLSA